MKQIIIIKPLQWPNLNIFIEENIKLNISNDMPMWKFKLRIKMPK